MDHPSNEIIYQKEKRQFHVLNNNKEIYIDQMPHLSRADKTGLLPSHILHTKKVEF
jgi:hypothetical protein